jgi:drug/metabolite transporter (DMT)-like permease
MKINARLYALIAASLFGISAPLSKLLLGNIPPLQLAGLLYLGSGLTLLLLKLLLKVAKSDGKEASLHKPDFPWLLGAVISGGVLAPMALMYGLSTTPAATASILLNFEAVSTTLLAAMLFREHIGKRVVVALSLLTLASLTLALNTSGTMGFSIGTLFIVLACILWGIDNNLTRNISSKDPAIIVIVKGIGAGSFSFVLSLLTGNELPSVSNAFLALIVGGACYGASLMLFILALRGLGSARSSALFASAPFIGALASFVIFQEAPTFQFVVSIPLMMAGAYLLFKETHLHSHEHKKNVHDHIHSHSDDHHTHTHNEQLSSTEKHSHRHQHDTVRHFHNHMPDLYHRHEH